MEGPGQIQETLRNYKGHDGLSYGKGWGGGVKDYTMFLT